MAAYKLGVQGLSYCIYCSKCNTREIWAVFSWGNKLRPHTQMTITITYGTAETIQGRIATKPSYLCDLQNN